MKQVFESYLAAINDHDIEGALSYLDNNFRLVFVGSEMSMTKEQVVDVYGWDAGANGNVRHEELTVSENCLSGIFVEQNDFLKLIDIPELNARVTYKFGKNGLIEEQQYELLPNQPSFAENMKPATEWAREHRRDMLEEVYLNGQMVFNEEMARKWVALLAEWRESVGLPLPPAR
jgi:hypothetical protein